MKSTILALLLSFVAILPAAASTTARLNRTWVETGVMKHDQEGLSLHVDFDLTDAKGQIGRAHV